MRRGRSAGRAIGRGLGSQVASILHVPVRMRRPFSAPKARGDFPLEETRWADSSRIERVPDVAALAHPAVLGARRPPAFRAANARSGWSAAGGLFDFGPRFLGQCRGFRAHGCRAEIGAGPALNRAPLRRTGQSGRKIVRWHEVHCRHYISPARASGDHARILVDAGIPSPAGIIVARIGGVNTCP